MKSNAFLYRPRSTPDPLITCALGTLVNQILFLAASEGLCVSIIKLNKSSSVDEIPERDVTYHLIMITSLPLNYDTRVLPEYFLSNAYLLHI